MSELCYQPGSSFGKSVEKIDRYAKTGWPVLLTGQSGVGKELLAARLHQKSQRRYQRFLPINCGALPSALFEGELFGYVKGAFSGAIQGSAGLFRSAHRGTVFLDEIGELEWPLQVKLLRFLETGEVRALGSSQVEHVDVRVVAATNVDLYQAAKQGRFRPDLLHRLAVLLAKVPPLKERPEDISVIAQKILREYRCRYEPAILPYLKTLPWPGNVRQLKNVLARATALSQRRVTLSILQQVWEEEAGLGCDTTGIADSGNVFYEGTLEQIEKQAITQRLRRLGGSRTRTAKELGIGKSTLHYKLRQWNLDCPVARTASHFSYQ